jgi:glycosyltransferase involved in cell wall biosynthesis
MSSASSGASPEPGLSVSVVVPCYNAQATIRRALASVAAQSVRPTEVIAVDDASTDATADELTRLAAEHGAGWLRVLRLPANRGPASARNAGWAAARGAYVAFLDADDTWHPRKLEVQLGVMRERRADLVAHLHDFADRPSRVAAEPPRVTGVRTTALLLSNRFVTPSVVVRRDIGERFREGARYMEDHRLWLDMAYAGRTLLLVHLPLATLHKPAFGASGQSAALLAMERAELGNYLWLWRAGRIGLGALIALWVWSGAKFLRRVLVVSTRRLIG